MNKKMFFIFAFTLLLLVGTVSATLDDAEVYYSFDNGDLSGSNPLDLSGNGYDGVSSGTFTTGSSGALHESFYFNSGVVTVGDHCEMGSSGSLAFWLKTVDDGGRFVFKNQASPTRSYYMQIIDGSLAMSYSQNGGGIEYNNVFSSTNIDDGNYHHYVIMYNGSNNTVTAYRDGSLFGRLDSGDNVPSSIYNNDQPVNLMGQLINNNVLVGNMDEFACYTRTLTPSEAIELYNSGVGFNPYADHDNFTVSVNDFSSSPVVNISVTVDGSTYINLSGSSITTALLENASSTYLVEVEAFNYFPRNYSSFNVSSDLLAVLHQSEISFITKELISNVTLSGVTYVVDGETNSTFYLAAGEYNVTASKSGYYDKNLTFNVSALDNLTLNVTGMFDSLVSFNLTDIVTTDLIATTSYVSVDDGSGYVANYSNSNGSISGIALIQGNYNVTLWADDYTYRYENVTVNSSSQTFSFSLYSSNSVWVTAKNFLSGSSLTDFTAEIYNANRTYTLNDSGTGLIMFSNVTSGVYTVSVTKTDFTTASYPLTVTGGSHQNVVAYLISSADSTIFGVTDIISGSVIEGATINMYKTIDGSWVLVSSDETDITGRVRIYYSPNLEYKFVIDKVGYEQREFFLNILFSTYTIRLTADTVSLPSLSGGAWVYAINNSGFFYDDIVNPFELSISSGTGTLEYYYLNVTEYNGTLHKVNCSNSYGCNDVFSFNITGATWNQTINVSYTVKESGRAAKTFRTFYIIQNIVADDTLATWKNVGGDGFGSLEKAFAATIILLILTGAAAVASLSLGVPAVSITGIVLAVGAGLMAAVGFIPVYVSWLIMLGVVMIVIFGRGEI